MFSFHQKGSPMKRNILGVAAFGLVSLGMALAARADVKLPHVIGSHMVVQQQRPVVIWGWADPGEAVTVSSIKRPHKARPTTREIGRSRFRP
jgi:hypothetical protein